MQRAFRRSIVVCACILFVACVSPAVAKSYSADRFDSTVRVLPDGTLDVTETVVFRFGDVARSQRFSKMVEELDFGSLGETHEPREVTVAPAAEPLGDISWP